MINIKWNTYWQTASGKSIRYPISDVIRDFIVKYQNDELHIAVGTDSQRKSKEGLFLFATVIVLYRQCKGGIYFVKRGKGKQKNYTHKHSITTRMIAEVEKTIQVAKILLPMVEKYDVSFSVHGDINTNPTYRSYAALSQATAIALWEGLKLIPKSLKTHSMGHVTADGMYPFASSKVANLCVQ